MGEPFLRWAGGKRQLLNVLDANLPVDIKEFKIIRKYIEPFLGGGSMFFHLKNNYKIKKAYLGDLNSDLILTYNVIKDDYDVVKLIDYLYRLGEMYNNLEDEERRKTYYAWRDKFNRVRLSKIRSHFHIEIAALMIILNRLGFNGLYRVNSKGKYNVPFGSKRSFNFNYYNLINVNEDLKVAELFSCDFNDFLKYVDDETFVYLDPPYIPISNTSNFTNYTHLGFKLEDHIRLSKFVKTIDKRGGRFLLSNSDPKNVDPDNGLIENLYGKFNISRVPARRVINSDPNKRGYVYEVLVKNY